MPWIRSRASEMSAAPIVAIDPEHLFDDLPYRGQRIELPVGDLVQQAPQLRILGDGVLEVRLRPRGGDREHLAREVPPPPLLQQPIALEVGAMLADPRPELGDVLPPLGLCEYDRHLPRTLPVEREHGTNLAQH